MVRTTTSAGTVAELGSYGNHQESVEKLLREMNARGPVVACLRDSVTPVRQADAAELIAIDVFTARPGCQG